MNAATAPLPAAAAPLIDRLHGKIVIEGAGVHWVAPHPPEIEDRMDAAKLEGLLRPEIRPLARVRPRPAVEGRVIPFRRPGG